MKHSHSNMTSPLNFKMSHAPVTSSCTFSILTIITKFLALSSKLCPSSRAGPAHSKAPSRKPPDSRYTNLIRLAQHLLGHHPTKLDRKLYVKQEKIRRRGVSIIGLEVWLFLMYQVANVF